MNEDRFETPRTPPWRESDGRSAYVIADPDRPGPVSRLADATERVQLEMAESLLAHARAGGRGRGAGAAAPRDRAAPRAHGDVRIARRVKH